MTGAVIVYVAASIALPAYHLPQMAKCARDSTRLASYSMSKAGMQLVLRLAMLPFVFGGGNVTMMWVVSLDFAGRFAEFVVALISLRRQGMTWSEVGQRCLPVRWRDRTELVATPLADAPVVESAPPEKALQADAESARSRSAAWGSGCIRGLRSTAPMRRARMVHGGTRGDGQTFGGGQPPT